MEELEKPDRDHLHDPAPKDSFFSDEKEDDCSDNVVAVIDGRPQVTAE